MSRIRSVVRRVFAIGSVAGAIIGVSSSPAAQQSFRDGPRGRGFVYLMTNDPERNSILQFRTGTNGRLALEDHQATGGRGGTGNGGDIDPLGSQNSLVINGDGSRLLAVNAGSDEISVLGVTRRGLTLLDTERSNGDFPNSVALKDNLVYVLNAHGTPNVSGFRLDGDGGLRQLAGSTRPLPGGAAAVPHDIRFSPDGSRLIVTDEGANQIDVFDVGNDGLITGVTTTPSAGAVPFGITFGRGAELIVTEAASSSVSSYHVSGGNGLDLISPAVANGQAAACWISITPHSQAFVSNTASATLSSYKVGSDGRPTLVKAVAATTGTGSAPIDSALSSDNAWLHVVDSALGRVLTYRVTGTELTAAATVTRLPRTIQGIAAR